MSFFKFFMALTVVSISLSYTFAETSSVSSMHHSDICGERSCEFLFKKMKKFARNGSPIAQATLSMMYAKGMGTEKNQELSIKYIKRAANNGLPIAEYTLGQLYKKGQLVGDSGKEADYWLKRAAKSHYKPAIDLLAAENKGIFEEASSNQKAIYTPDFEDDIEVLVVHADKYSLTDFYNLIKSEGYNNPSQTGSRIRGRGCSGSSCAVVNTQTPEGALKYFQFIMKTN